MVGGQNPGPEAPPMSKKGGSKRYVMGGATARGVGMSGSLKGRRSEEMTQSNTSSPWGQKYLLSCRRGDGS